MQAEILQDYLKKVLATAADVRDFLIAEDGSRCPVKLVCATLGVSRSSFYDLKGSEEKYKCKRGPKTEFSHEEVLEAIKEMLGETPFWDSQFSIHEQAVPE